MRKSCKWFKYHQQGWTLFPTPHILQHMVHQIPNTPDGEVYLQDCVAYWCQETGKAWFEGWTMEQLLIGLRAVPKDIPRIGHTRNPNGECAIRMCSLHTTSEVFLYNTGLSTLQQAMSLSAVKVLNDFKHLTGTLSGAESAVIENVVL